MSEIDSVVQEIGRRLAEREPDPIFDPIFAAGIDTLIKGAPGLGEPTRVALARSIAMKATHAITRLTQSSVNADLLAAAREAIEQNQLAEDSLIHHFGKRGYSDGSLIANFKASNARLRAAIQSAEGEG